MVGRMWKHLREQFQVVKVRVLHTRIPKNSSVDILRGVPEGSRLNPTLFGIFVPDLIHELKEKFPNATITHNGGIWWIGGILYVDDLCLISTDANELQMMINTCQTWSEQARMQLNADKTKVMCFPHNETTQVRNARYVGGICTVWKFAILQYCTNTSNIPIYTVQHCTNTSNIPIFFIHPLARGKAF